MITTIYKCDRCGAGQNTSDQFWRVDITIETVEKHIGHGSPLGKGKHWCRRCMEEYGLLPNVTEDVTPISPSPSLEDIIREIVRSIKT